MPEWCIKETTFVFYGDDVEAIFKCSKCYIDRATFKGVALIAWKSENIKTGVRFDSKNTNARNRCDGTRGTRPITRRTRPWNLNSFGDVHVHFSSVVLTLLEAKTETFYAVSLVFRFAFRYLEWSSPASLPGKGTLLASPSRNKDVTAC